MSLFKKKLSPVLVLTCCLIMIFFLYSWTDNKPTKIDNNSASQEETKKLNLFKNIQSISSDNSQNVRQQDQNSDNNPIKNTNLFEKKIIQDSLDDQNKILTSTNTETEIENNNFLSIENIITEAENLSLILKKKFDQKQEQELSNPPCLGVLAVSGGACNCVTLGCTPPIGPWCINPCCCVCCVACCGI